MGPRSPGRRGTPELEGAGAEGVPERQPGPAARLRFDSQTRHLLAA